MSLTTLNSRDSVRVARRGCGGTGGVLAHSEPSAAAILQPTHTHSVGRRKHFLPYFPMLYQMYTSQWEKAVATLRKVAEEDHEN